MNNSDGEILLSATLGRNVPAESEHLYLGETQIRYQSGEGESNSIEIPYGDISAVQVNEIDAEQGFDRLASGFLLGGVMLLFLSYFYSTVGQSMISSSVLSVLYISTLLSFPAAAAMYFVPSTVSRELEVVTQTDLFRFYVREQSDGLEELVTELQRVRHRAEPPRTDRASAGVASGATVDTRLESLRGDIETATRQMENERFEEALEQLSIVEDALSEIESSASRHLTPEHKKELSTMKAETKGIIQRTEREKQEARAWQAVDSVQEQLEAAHERIAAEEELERVQRDLNELEARSSSIVETAERTDHKQLLEEATALGRTAERKRESVIETRKTRNIPQHVPACVERSITYGDITEYERIGAGGNADVHRAAFAADGEETSIAVKKPRIRGTLHTAAVERIMDEAETWEQLDGHTHIVTLVSYGSTPIPWLAMEYLDGGHLGERAPQMDFPQSLWTAIAVTSAVRHAHRKGVAHLDLKPENVLFHSIDDAWDAPKVADWGLSKHLLTHSNTVEGFSPTYAAPEQFDDSFGSTDDFTDIYQLGAVFYELFTGRPPFDGEPAEVMKHVLDDTPEPPSSVAAVPTQVDDIVLTALRKEKAERYDDILYLRDDLQAVYDGHFRRQ